MEHRPNVSFHRTWISDVEFESSLQLEGETWIRFASFNGRKLAHMYQVSNKGRVKNVEGNLLRGSIDFDGYHTVSLSQRSTSNSLYVRVHQLVLRLFAGDPPSDMFHPTVQHINHDKLDNRIENLCWMSAFENNQEGHGRRVKILDESGEHIFASQKVASSYIGRHDDYISEGISQGYKLTNILGQEVTVFVERNNQWIEYIRPHSSNRKMCKLIMEGQEVCFDSFWACDNFLKKPKGYVSNRIANDWPIMDKSNCTFYIYDVDSSKYVEYAPRKHKTKNFANKCQIMYDPTNSQIFKSISAAARYIGRDPEYLRIAIKENRTIYDSNGQVVKATIVEG